MSIDQLDKIDFITTDISRDSVVLVISDHLAWNGIDEHILLLQDKLNAYLQFIENGQIYEAYPNANGKKITIEIKAKFIPDSEALKFLNLCKDQIEAAGINFEWNTLIE